MKICYLTKSGTIILENGAKQSEIELTKKQNKILLYLLENKNKVCFYEDISREIYDEDICFDDMRIKTFVARLRKKVNNIFEIKNKTGMGYILKSIKGEIEYVEN